MAQKGIRYALWDVGKIQHNIAVLVECSQSAISKITRKTCLKQSNYGSKTKATVWNERHLNKILISNRFANFGEISKSCNDSSVGVFRSPTLRRLHQYRYVSRIIISKPLLTFKQKQKRSIWYKDHQNWSIDQCNKVICDEVRFCISFDDYWPNVWRKSYDRY